MNIGIINDELSNVFSRDLETYGVYQDIPIKISTRERHIDSTRKLLYTGICVRRAGQFGLGYLFTIPRTQHTAAPTIWGRKATGSEVLLSEVGLICSLRGKGQSLSTSRV